MARLTIGPARLINPFCFLVTLPAMYTAPGAAKRNPRNGHHDRQHESERVHPELCPGAIPLRDELMTQLMEEEPGQDHEAETPKVIGMVAM